MRKKKMIYRKSAPIFLLLFCIIAAAGTCLAVIGFTGDIPFSIDERKLIGGALADEGAGETDAAAAGADSVVSGNYAVVETEQKESGAGTEEPAGFLTLLIGTALSSAAPETGAAPAGGNGVVSSVPAEPPVPEAPPAASDIEGAVFIYHTHSTESYEPYSEGNYHVAGDAGTVRNVADALQTGLTAKGITVYHDKTLHDHPSYTNSYGRSLATAKSYLSQHPDIRVMVDLHRDARASGGSKYSTVDVNGKKATSFNIVVGQKNANYAQLIQFANRVLTKANELYPGLGGRIIEREYKFNQYLSNNYVLLEVGNNGNTIEEAELTGTLLADVFEAVMREL